MAQKEDWSQLYDCEALHATNVPVASASYYDVSTIGPDQAPTCIS